MSLLVNNNYKLLINSIGAIILFLLFFSEALSKVYYVTEGETIIFGKVLKAIILLTIFFFLLKNSLKKVVMYIVLPICLFSLGFVFLNTYPSYSVIIGFFKYVFPILLFFFFNTYIVSRKSSNYIFNVFEALILFNTLLIFIGYFFEIGLFKTYLGNRFGYNGLIKTSAASSYIYLITQYYFFVKITKLKINKWDYLKAGVVFLAGLLIGTKTLYLGSLFILVLILWNYYTKKYRLWMVLTMGILISFFGYYFLYFSDLFGKITSDKGVVTSILSFRDELFITKTYPFIQENWNFGNYLFGGMVDASTRTQMSFIDLVYSLGIIGGIYYIYIYYTSYFIFKKSKYDYSFFIFLVCAVFISGNFFLYTTIPIFLIVLKNIIIESLSVKN